MSNTETVYPGKYLNVLRKGRWEYTERAKSSGVVAIAACYREQLILTEQFRHPVDRIVIDLPAGLVGDSNEDENEAAQSAAERELLEETGFRARHWQNALTIPTSPGLTSELVEIFVAKELEKASAGGGVGEEDIKVHLVPPTNLNRFWKEQRTAGKLIDPKVYVALHLLEYRAE
ncbi:ADP-ribose pyrophosphatase [Polystyrenella longa]|uniref:GDP-mannose pyrophosphatase n=1 Tax=Polystyrenella longa TaxID=2528007 RepID=A0A518CMJ9_9PLAN|nr:NUDIX hydrolase [Polystyrenella longa]QDU80455.1 ADP-ribose pyrophosphatase [Polystyrenella longa]